MNSFLKFLYGYEEDENTAYEGYVNNLAKNKTQQLFFNKQYKNVITIATLFKYSENKICIYCNNLDEFITNDLIILIAFEKFISRKKIELNIITVDDYITKSDYLIKLLNKYSKKINWYKTQGIKKEILKVKHATYIIGDENMLIYRYENINECNFNTIHAKSLQNKFNSITYTHFKENFLS